MLNHLKKVMKIGDKYLINKFSINKNYKFGLIIVNLLLFSGIIADNTITSKSVIDIFIIPPL